MPIIKVSKSDMLQGMLIPPGFYRAKCNNFEIKKPKSGGDSLNYVPGFQVQINPKDPTETVEVKHYINSAGRGNLAPLEAAKRGITLAAMLELGDFDLDTDSYIGEEFILKIDNEEIKGENRLTNKIKMFLNKNAEIPF